MSTSLYKMFLNFLCLCSLILVSMAVNNQFFLFSFMMLEEMLILTFLFPMQLIYHSIGSCSPSWYYHSSYRSFQMISKTLDFPSMLKYQSLRDLCSQGLNCLHRITDLLGFLFVKFWFSKSLLVAPYSWWFVELNGLLKSLLVWVSSLNCLNWTTLTGKVKKALCIAGAGSVDVHRLTLSWGVSCWSRIK